MTEYTTSGTGWARIPPLVPLDAMAVHIWLGALDQPPSVVARMLALLTEAEQQQAGRFRFERDRRRYIVAHRMLRDLLGTYTRHDPSAVTLGAGAYGKPFIQRQADEPDLRFNLSHSHEAALVALTLGREVGVDVEFMRPLDDADIVAQHFFAPTERATLAALAEQEKLPAFYTCWSRKEAIIKALGLGLALPLDAFDVTLAPGVPAQLLRLDTAPPQTTRWQLADLPPIPGYAAALASEGASVPCRHFQWEPEMAD
jgi:4'-phosphopantetheinyl transferase